jgi:hypothetical protein
MQYLAQMTVNIMTMTTATAMMLLMMRELRRLA